MVGRYRLRKATLGSNTETNLGMYMPAGSILEIPTAPQKGDRTVQVSFGGMTMITFVQDLADRADKHSSEASGAALATSTNS